MALSPGVHPSAFNEKGMCGAGYPPWYARECSLPGASTS